MCHESPAALAGLGAFFLMGLSGSLHCMGMCGPLIALWLPPGGRRGALAWYHLARWWSYVALGVLAAALAHHLTPFIPQQYFLAAATLLLLVGTVRHTLWLPRGAMPWLIRRGRVLAALPPATRAAFVGLMTPLLPCGLLYGVLGACAAAPRATDAALWMSAFVAGTVPLLLLTQSSMHWLRQRLPAAWLRGFSFVSTAISVGLLWWMSHSV